TAGVPEIVPFTLTTPGCTRTAALICMFELTVLVPPPGARSRPAVFTITLLAVTLPVILGRLLPVSVSTLLAVPVMLFKVRLAGAVVIPGATGSTFAAIDALPDRLVWPML